MLQVRSALKQRGENVVLACNNITLFAYILQTIHACTPSQRPKERSEVSITLSDLCNRARHRKMPAVLS